MVTVRGQLFLGTNSPKGHKQFRHLWKKRYFQTKQVYRCYMSIRWWDKLVGVGADASYSSSEDRKNRDLYHPMNQTSKLLGYRTTSRVPVSLARYYLIVLFSTLSHVQLLPVHEGDQFKLESHQIAMLSLLKIQSNLHTSFSTHAMLNCYCFNTCMRLSSTVHLFEGKREIYFLLLLKANVEP